MPGHVEKYPFLAGKYAFKVCRIEPENNIHLVLEAFDRQADMPLVLVGNWENSAYGRQLRRQYAGSRNLHLLDPIYHQKTLNSLRSNCTLYVHGHSAGGTNPSLVEAMYLGLPVAAFDVSYNRITTGQQACYFDSAGELSELLSGLQDEKLQTMGSDMLSLARSRYTWSRIANAYAYLATPTVPAPVLVPVPVKVRSAR